MFGETFDGNRADKYWWWSTPIRILIVIDGRVTLSKDPDGFGLGFVLDTLEDQSGWWVRFVADVAKRDGCLDARDLGGRQLKYSGFRFTQSGFDLFAYDQIWFFGDQPNRNDGADGATTDADIAGFGLDAVEQLCVAEWMESGGGVFATGDHSILGASLCSRIPRVRTMRKWTHAQGVPARDGPSRHETVQLLPTGREWDTVLQPMELVYRRARGFPPFSGPLEHHPLFASSLGIIDRFPDHMHEGEVIADDEVQLDAPLDIPGYRRPEYPSAVPEVLASAGVATPVQRPRPHVVAYGRTTNLQPPEVMQSVSAARRVPEVNGPLGFSKRFGLVGVYDGDSAGIGRVVVDSTWHHWFSHNLSRIATLAANDYSKMQAYYRNVGLWLGRPADRRSMLVAATWGVLTGSAPMEFGPNDSPWDVGGRVLDALDATASAGMLHELAESFLDRRLLAALGDTNARPDCCAALCTLPRDLTSRAVFGCIGLSLLDLAFDHTDRRAKGERPRLDVEAIRRCAVDGASRAHALLGASIGDAAEYFGTLNSTLSALGKAQTPDVRIPVEIRRLRIVADALQLPDAGDPAVAGGTAVVTIRLRRDDDVVTDACSRDVELPPFEVRTGLNELSTKVVGEVEVQTGETLSVEVLAGRWGSVAADPEAVRFTDTLRGDASGWIGKRAPARSQAWRLWYRIEAIETAATR